MPPISNSERLRCHLQTEERPKTESGLNDPPNHSKMHDLVDYQRSNSAHDAFHIFELPAEVRMLIYDLLFANTKLLIGFGYLPDEVFIACEGRHHDYHSLLRTCKFIRADAMPILAHNTTLLVQRNPYRRLEPQRLKMSTVWRSRIRKIEYDTSPNLMFVLKDLPNLQSIVLESKIHHLDLVWEKSQREIELFIEGRTRKAKRLAEHGFHGLQEGDGIEVTLKAWIMNTKLRAKTSSGLEVIFDVRN